MQRLAAAAVRTAAGAVGAEPRGAQHIGDVAARDMGWDFIGGGAVVLRRRTQAAADIIDDQFGGLGNLEHHAVDGAIKSLALDPVHAWSPWDELLGGKCHRSRGANAPEL
jgi:hypothetical protein